MTSVLPTLLAVALAAALLPLLFSLVLNGSESFFSRLSGGVPKTAPRRVRVGDDWNA